MSAGYLCQTGSHGYNPSDSKSLWGVIGVANELVKITEWGMSMDGVTPTAIPATVDLCKSTAATAGTSTAGTITQVRGQTRTVRSAVNTKYSAESTVLTPIKTWYVPEFGGSLSQQAPLGRELEIAGAIGIVLRVTMSATTGATNARGYVEIEEG